MNGSKGQAMRLAEICWALSDDPVAEWTASEYGHGVSQEEIRDCFVVIKSAKQFPPMRRSSSMNAEMKREREFRRLVEEWRREVAHLSSTTARLAHPAYKKIIQMGPDILPLLLRELAERGGHWFVALEQIAEVDPTDPRDSGNVPALTKAWTTWGREHGYIKYEGALSNAQNIERVVPRLMGMSAQTNESI